jgi:hypothetical protein
MLLLLLPALLLLCSKLRFLGVGACSLTTAATGGGGGGGAR